ncbi:hypothetical protein [Chryseobacterium sp. CT-SW4]|uniref:hypothetical protein n=1 Tax=Chryseobacterium sp. SW-1 TaxID=3157343 RepID=UPI003B010A50
MKKLFLNLSVLSLLIISTSCNSGTDAFSSADEFTNVSSSAKMADTPVASSDYIQKIIFSIEQTAEYIKTNEGKTIPQDQIDQYVLDVLVKNGVGIQTETPKNLELSGEFYSQASIIAYTKDFNDENEYLLFLDNKQKEIIESKLTSTEKQILIEEIEFQGQLVKALVALDQKYNPNAVSKKGWWGSWGKCAAGILGGAVTGAGTLGLAGAAVGTVALPVVGTVSAGAVGAIAGAVGGGLTGAATFC